MEFNFKSALVKSGSKVTDESAPILNLTSTFNVMKLNRKAMTALGVGVGDRVVMFDVGSAADDLNNRFFICKSFEVNGVDVGSKITSDGRFSYSIIYGAILAQDMDVTSIAPESLIERGLLQGKNEDKTSQYIALKTMSAKLQPVNDGEEVTVADGVSRPMFVITDMAFVEHTPKSMGGSSFGVEE